MTRLPPFQIAGLFSLLAAVLVLGVWYVLLFVAPPEGMPVSESAIATARYLLFEETTTRHWFIWLAALPVASVVIGICYLAAASRSKTFALALLVLTALLGGTSFFLLNWAMAFFVTLPVYWGYIGVRKA